MSRQSRRERERTISELALMGVRYEDAARLLKYGATLQRLSEAQCNGDWPADNGTGGGVCDLCEGTWRKTYKNGAAGVICPDCRTQQLAEVFAVSLGLTAVFQGDPRGGVFGVTKGGRVVWVA